VTVRQKITLLITAAGFFSSLAFSSIIASEMVEQPFRIMDSELAETAMRAVHLVLSRGDEDSPEEAPSIGGARYWLDVRDRDSGRSMYRSRLAKLVAIPETAPNSSVTVSVVVPRAKLDLGQDSRGEVSFRVRSMTIPSAGKTLVVRAGRPMEKLEEEMADMVVAVVSGLAFSVLLLMAISYFLAGFILKPVAIIDAQARDISARHLDRRIPVTGDRDEFSALARTLNHLFDRLEDAFVKQKRLLADASHELKTPLAIMRLELEALYSPSDQGAPDLGAEGVARLTDKVLRMERLVTSILDLSALEIDGTKTEEVVDLSELLESLIDDYRVVSQATDIRLESHLPSHLMVRGDAQMLRRAFSNILDNAIKYNLLGGRVTVVGNPSANGVSIMVTNTGPGVGSTEIPKLFDPFYRVEPSRSPLHGGAGLGLAIVKRIVELHGGTVTFESQPGSPTAVSVNLPRCRYQMSV